MLTLGDYNTLRIVKSVDFGLYLDGGEEGEILLPQRYVTNDMHIGDEIEVFIYLDQEERPVATTEHPIAKVGEFAWLEVAWVNQYGAFLKWGLMKDLFCPFREQKMRMEQGHSYIVYIKVDEDSYRLMATAKIDRYLSLPTKEEEDTLRHGTQVEILVWQKTDLGFKAIINNRYQGLLYENQIFQPIHSGPISTTCARMARSTSPSRPRAVSTRSTSPRSCCATSMRTTVIAILATSRPQNSSTTVSRSPKKRIRKPSATCIAAG